ncbi:hypothetical protein MSATCC14277_1990 [Metamycoplasma salivarium]|uniref:PIN-like domain-containing protein n=1 Tax=Metamycoplasma salivarium TaxID=2124 RepID=UPI001F48B38D|nr:PIN domain-containing protein [Metamycoplasma salivarium]GIZ05617.1 hypothetical protein MSATCC14277_1990 [Metamycoplasma salivarium]
MINKKINLFIDTNIWLSIYEFSSDDLNVFKQISKLISTKFNLIITEQVYDEFWRNRENKIKEIINMLSNGKYNFSIGFPNIIRGYKEFHEIIEKLNQFKYWNNADVIELCEIAIKNNQINDIFQDDDIWGFYNNLIINRFPLFNNEYVSQVLTLIWQDQVGEQWN